MSDDEQAAMASAGVIRDARRASATARHGMLQRESNGTRLGGLERRLAGGAPRLRAHGMRRGLPSERKNIRGARAREACISEPVQHGARV